MRILLICLPLLLAGCFTTTAPIKQKFPVAPEVLLEKCPQLHKAEENEKSIAELLKVVVKNYGLYYECAAKQDGWTEWYNVQKKIFDNVNK
jgi:hypothetical protein